MSRPKRSTAILVVTGLALIAYAARTQEVQQSEREAMYHRYMEFASYVKGGSIEPRWMADGSSFWYAEGAPANTVIWKVDPKANTKTPLFDTARLRQALTPLLGHELSYQGLPFAEFTFVDGEKAAKFTLEDKELILRLDTYAITPLPSPSEEEKSRSVGQVVSRDISGHPIAREVQSPDGRWFVGTKARNLYLRSIYDGRTLQLTTDGAEDFEWLVGDWGYRAQWSPDSLKLAVKKVDYRQPPKLPIVHWLNPTEEVTWLPVRSDFSTTKAGMPLPRTELFILDIVSKREVQVDVGQSSDQHIHILAWRPDGSELIFVRADRLLKKLDLMAANPESGATRVILTETEKTFIVGIQIFYRIGHLFSLFADGKKFVWISERDAWNHLYLYDIEGNLIQRLTAGDFPAVRIEAVDEKAGWVYFTAHGDRQRPYDTQLYRVNLDGKGLARLTEGTGQHSVQFSPSKAFFLDTHSSTDRPPVVELRGADGALVQVLARANVEGLRELQWGPPEEFVVKAADGKTDLYGVLYKPYDFDPNGHYPVIEAIYGCPQVAVVPRGFILQSVERHGQALAQLGFITFVVDARGTPERGKEFQDVAYGNIGRHEIPDHAAALKQLAQTRPYMDLSRVGITGHSCGGYMTIRALLFAPDVYHVGVASAPMTDLYFGNAMELYMGLPQNNKDAYEYASNLRLASNLKGKLLLIHGTSDFSVPLSATIKMVEALTRANKPYDLILLPELDHYYTGASARYAQDATRRYFQEHLKPE